MSEPDELQSAVEKAEAEVAALETEAAALVTRRHELSREQLATLQARRSELAQALRLANDERANLSVEQTRLRAELHRPRFRWASFVAPPVTWFFRSAAFTIYVSSVVAAHRLVQSPGLVIALVLGLPVAFVLVSVAGSLRESGAAEQAGVGTSQGEDPARQPAVDGRAVTPPGGPGDDRAAERSAERARTGAGE